jgi:hypothetical protein
MQRSGHEEVTLMNVSFRLLGFLSALLASGTAPGIELQVGNVAPGSDTVQLYVGGRELGPRLAYGEFATVSQAGGEFAVSAVRRQDDRVLATVELELAPRDAVEPILLLTGNDAAQPYDLRLYQRAGMEGDERNAKALSNASVALHHLAPYAVPESNPWLEFEQACAGSSAAGGSSNGSGGTIRFGHARTLAFNSVHDEWRCVLRIADPVFGAFEVPRPLTSERTTRFLLVGDGERAPFEVLVVERGTVIHRAGANPPAPGAVVHARDLWYDLSRPAQAVSLYEIAGGQDTLGFWFTQGTDGLPEWFYFDGTATGLPGQRDLVVYRGTPGTAEPLTPVGSARLFYLDCNNAEIRILSGERRFDTLRLRRSRAVSTCELLD